MLSAATTAKQISPTTVSYTHLQRQDVVFGVDDGAQHPVVLLKPHKALKLVHFPVKAFLHLIQRGHVRVAGALHGAGAEGEGQMQKADEMCIRDRNRP